MGQYFAVSATRLEKYNIHDTFVWKSLQEHCDAALPQTTSPHEQKANQNYVCTLATQSFMIAVLTSWVIGSNLAISACM